MWIDALALVTALAGLGISVHTWHNAPGARLWRELRNRVEDLEHDNEQQAELRARRARVGNIGKATEARQVKRTLAEEAAAILAAGGAAAPKQKQLQLDGLSDDELRRTAYPDRPH